MSERLALSVEGASVEIDLDRGVMTDLAVQSGGRVIRPLHRAHWVGGPAAPLSGLAPIQAGLEGEFLSAPFGRDDVTEDSPIHGPAANSRWSLGGIRRDGPRLVAELVLDAPVRGARLTKRLTLSDHAPVVVIEHEISGGTGYLTLAHHPMLRFAGPGRLSFSAKRAVLTGQGVEPGRHRLAIAARGTDPAAAPGQDAPQDLTHWPWSLEDAPGHEDFCTLVEAEGATLGWTVALRPVEDDLVVFAKDPATLPVTMLWLSNGGRDFAPWDGRHIGVVGIEDGCTAGDEGNRAAAAGTSRVAAEGVPAALALAPGRVHRTRLAIGVAARPAGWETVASVEARDGALILATPDGRRLSLALPGGASPAAT